MRPWALLLLAGLATAGEPARDTTATIFPRFDHGKHERALGKAGLGCPACHQVGATGDFRLAPDALDRAFLQPPRGACHYCHNPEQAAPVARAPQRCDTCHDNVPPPTSHGAGWRELHGSEARLATLQCKSCHARSDCVECHERRNRLELRVHERTWLSVHGIAAKTNPFDCVACHVQADCVACHAGRRVQ